MNIKSKKPCTRFENIEFKALIFNGFVVFQQTLVKENEISSKSKNITDSFFSKSGFWDSNYKHMSIENETNLLDDEDFIKVFQLCLSHLPENWNKAVHFKYIIEKNPTEICQELAISMSNYWQVIHRAKLMLKKCIEINYYKIA